MTLKTYYLLPVAWLLVITLLSVTPSVPMPDFNLFSVDKLGHAVAYGVLSWLLLRAYLSYKGVLPGWQERAWAFGVSSGYGALMECVQGAFFPGRFFEIDDMLANTAGALAAVLLFRYRIPTRFFTS